MTQVKETPKTEVEIRAEIMAEMAVNSPEVKQNATFAVNPNYKGVNEEQIVKSAGLKYAEQINRTLTVHSVELIGNNGNPFYSIKADDSISDKPLDCAISMHHYESFGFAELLPIGRHSGKVVKVKGINADVQTGYYDKKTNTVIAYWRNGFFITEPRSNVGEAELTAKRAIDNEVTSLERKLERLLGAKFDPSNPLHLATLSALS